MFLPFDLSFANATWVLKISQPINQSQEPWPCQAIDHEAQGWKALIDCLRLMDLKIQARQQTTWVTRTALWTQETNTVTTFSKMLRAELQNFANNRKEIWLFETTLLFFSAYVPLSRFLHLITNRMTLSDRGMAYLSISFDHRLHDLRKMWKSTSKAAKQEQRQEQRHKGRPETTDKAWKLYEMVASSTVSLLAACDFPGMKIFLTHSEPPQSTELQKQVTTVLQ